MDLNVLTSGLSSEYNMVIQKEKKDLYCIWLHLYNNWVSVIQLEWIESLVTDGMQALQSLYNHLPEIMLNLVWQWACCIEVLWSGCKEALRQWMEKGSGCWILLVVEERNRAKQSHPQCWYYYMADWERICRNIHTLILKIKVLQKVLQAVP